MPSIVAQHILQGAPLVSVAVLSPLLRAVLLVRALDVRRPIARRVGQAGSRGDKHYRSGGRRIVHRMTGRHGSGVISPGWKTTEVSVIHPL